jgi:hypothetical protein
MVFQTNAIFTPTTAAIMAATISVQQRQMHGTCDLSEFKTCLLR